MDQLQTLLFQTQPQSRQFNASLLEDNNMMAQETLLIANPKLFFIKSFYTILKKISSIIS